MAATHTSYLVLESYWSHSNRPIIEKTKITKIIAPNSPAEVELGGTGGGVG